MSDALLVAIDSGEVLTPPFERRHMDGRTLTVTGVHSPPSDSPWWLGRVTLGGGGVCVPFALSLRIVPASAGLSQAAKGTAA